MTKARSRYKRGEYWHTTERREIVRVMMEAGRLMKPSEVAALVGRSGNAVAHTMRAMERAAILYPGRYGYYGVLRDPEIVLDGTGG